MKKTDFLVVGAGIMGLSIARELSLRYPDAKITIIEKENEAAFHASGRNSGVLHAGFYYSADSLKAAFTVKGNKALTDYCLENGLPIRRCGKVVVASDEGEVSGVDELKRRGDLNGVQLSVIDEKELADIEPAAKTCRKALFSPTTSSVNPKIVCRHIADHFSSRVEIVFNCVLVGVKKNIAVTNTGKIRFAYLYNAAGLYADKIALHFGIGREYTLIPFKGIYLKYNDDRFLRRHIYPVPNLKNPFLGVHFTITADGHTKIGPTAIPGFWRENYDFKSRFQWSEFVQILAWQMRLFLFNHFNFRHLALEEIRKYHRSYFIETSKKLVKKLDAGQFGEYTNPGIRAQLLNKRTCELVMDFVVEPAERSTHVLNSVSPAFTTAFPFAEYIVQRSARYV